MFNRVHPKANAYYVPKLYRSLCCFSRFHTPVLTAARMENHEGRNKIPFRRNPKLSRSDDWERSVTRASKSHRDRAWNEIQLSAHQMGFAGLFQCISPRLWESPLKCYAAHPQECIAVQHFSQTFAEYGRNVFTRLSAFKCPIYIYRVTK